MKISKIKKKIWLILKEILWPYMNLLKCTNDSLEDKKH